MSRELAALVDSRTAGLIRRSVGWLACSLLLVGCGPRWYRVSDESGRVSVEMPDPIELKAERRVSSEYGEIVFAGFESSGEPARWRVGPLPRRWRPSFRFVATRAAALPGDHERFVRQYAEDHAAALGARDTEGKDALTPFETAACKGFEITGSSEVRMYRVRVCIVDSTLYTLRVIGEREEVEGAEGRRFFDSFRIND